MSDNKPAKKPYELRRTRQRLEHGGQEYLVDDIVEAMSQGNKMSTAVYMCYPDFPKASMASLMTKIKKHPYYIAHKDLSLKLMNDKGPALQQNMLDLAFNSRSDMVKFQATKDAMDRVYGEADITPADEKPSLVFNFSFGDNTPAPKVDVQKVIDGEVVN